MNPCSGYLHAYEAAAVTFGLSYAGCARIGLETLERADTFTAVGISQCVV